MKSDEQAHPFGIVPVEVMMDNRLTLETMRVLVTLFSFRNKLTGLAFPSRDAISERCGMHPANISAATTKLVELGWLVKTGAGGYSKSTKYDIQIPEKVAEQATIYKAKCEARKQIKVAQSATVAEQATLVQSATREGSPIGYHPLAESATRKEQTNITDKVTENTITPPKKSPSENLLSEIDPQIAADFLAIRKAKNLPLTKTAFHGIEREAEKLGYSLEKALTICCERGWGGFNASWVLKGEKSLNNKDQEKKEATERAKARLFGLHTEKDVTNETTRL